jgi:hypothetical protein
MFFHRVLMTAGFIVGFPFVALFVFVAMFWGGLRAIWFDKA